MGSVSFFEPTASTYAAGLLLLVLIMAVFGIHERYLSKRLVRNNQGQLDLTEPEYFFLML